MKTLLTKCLTISSIGLLMLAACKKQGVEVKSASGTAGTLAVNNTTIPLDKSKQNDTTTVVNFTFTKAAFGFNAAITNTIEIDAAGDNWVNPTSFTLPLGVYSQSFSTSVFNSLLLKLNLPPGVVSTVNARLVNSLAPNVPAIYSNMLALKVTPYSLVSYVYVPGNYEGSSWPNPGPQEDSLQSATGNGIYVGVIPIKLVNDQFLITPVKNWNNKYAATGAGAPSNGGVLTYATEYVTGGGSNFYSASTSTVDPNFNITSDMAVLNTSTNKLTLTPTLWSVVGDATPGGWPAGSGYQSDTDMSYNNGTQTWSVVVHLTAGGGIKFRLNHAWNVDYGSVTTPGVLDTNNNNNIAITVTGDYLVTIDLNALTYKLTKQ